MIDTYKFGYLQDGREVTAYKIQNRHGEYAVIINYGAIIQSLCVEDKNGNIADVVLGARDGENIESARNSAAVIGRCANRIAYGRFSIDGRDYQLVTKRGHHLHGAQGNYSCKLFSGEIVGDNSVTLYHRDLGEDGWECEADVFITYTFDDDHALTIDYSITAHGDTVISPTNHAYFNLDMPNQIVDTELKVFTEHYAPKSELGMPDGSIKNVKGTPFDFTEFIPIGLAFSRFGEMRPDGKAPGYDDFFLMPGDGFRQVAEAVCRSSGRIMRVFSDAECLILFTPGKRAGALPVTGKSGEVIDGNAAFCIEMQYVPNAVNCPQYKSPVFRNNETMRSRTVYAFDKA